MFFSNWNKEPDEEKNYRWTEFFHNSKWKMQTGARARKQKYIYIYIYISLYMKTFLKTGVYNLKEKSRRSGGHTCGLNGFEVTHFFSELSPGLNRVNTTAWIMVFTNINVMIFFEILFAWDNIWRFHMMAISFWCPSTERLEGLKRQLLWSV